MSTVVSRCMTALLMFGCALPVENALGQDTISLAVPSFTQENAALVHVTGDAMVRDGHLRLTRERYNLSGAALYHTPRSLADNRSFNAYFSFRMWRPSGAKELGADGIAFVVQNSLSSLPGEGRDLGYKGSGQSLIVEFDTFTNGGVKDPNNNHIGINLNGNIQSLSTTKAPFILNDGTLYHAWVDYDGAQQLLEVRLSPLSQRPEAPILAYTLGLAEVLASQVFVGFTSATGGDRQRHEVHSFFFHNEFMTNGIDTSTTQYSME
jgi:hypothetical protein